MTAVQLGPAPRRRRLALAFAAAMRGVLHVSESDAPYQPFHAPDGGGPVDAERLRRAARIGARFRIDLLPADDFFAHRRESEEPAGEAYATLEAMMRATLSDVWIGHVGRGQTVRVRTFLLGDAGDGLAGLRTIAIET